MDFLKETTVWDCEYNVPNHIYLVEGTTAFGYIKEGTDEIIMFSKGVFFDKRKRQFKKLTMKERGLYNG